jgi:hypothetical protein
MATGSSGKVLGKAELVEKRMRAASDMTDASSVLSEVNVGVYGRAAEVNAIIADD